MTQQSHDKMRDPAYLGDGVYVGNDGYQLWLSVNTHTNPIIALEPGSAQAILEYAKAKGVGI